MKAGFLFALLWIWQFPQHLLALFFKLVWRPGCTEIFRGRAVYRVRQRYVGLSLGNYIFLSHHYRAPTVAHEYGHSVQSRLLGPLYLPLIVLPSLCCYICDRLFHNSWPMEQRIRWYYNQPTEKNADKLGLVDRKNHLYE